MGIDAGLARHAVEHNDPDENGCLNLTFNLFFSGGYQYERLFVEATKSWFGGLNLTVMDGLEVCRRARTFYSNPILMMTARDREDDEIMGLEYGADDYLAKPVKPSILLARLRALLRRANHELVSTIVRIGHLQIDAEFRTVTLHDEPVALSTLEFDILLLLASKVGQCLGREALIAEVRGIEYDGFDRSVDVCISRLRRKLGDDAQEPRRIKMLRGVGYLLAADAW